MRARSFAPMSSTAVPLSWYLPSVGLSSRPRIDNSVDLPQPDGPEIDTYSPGKMEKWTPASACVSTSSVKNTFLMSLSEIRAWLSLFMGLSQGRVSLDAECTDSVAADSIIQLSRMRSYASQAEVSESTT